MNLEYGIAGDSVASSDGNSVGSMPKIVDNRIIIGKNAMKMMAAIFGMTVLLSTQAMAANCNGVVDDFSQKSQEIVRDIRAKNGFVNSTWSKMAEPPTDVSIEASAWLERPETPESSEIHLSRESAEWSCRSPNSSKCKIQVNCTLWPKTSADAKKVVALHERAGTHHLDDGHYQNSLRLWVLSLPETEHFLTPDEKQSIQKEVQMAGGITGVGGGGDTAGVVPQIILIKQDLNKLKGVAEPSERARLFARLHQDFSIRTEVRRAQDGSLLETFSNAPVDRARDVRLVTSCLQLLDKPRSDQQAIFVGMTKNDDSMLQRVPTVEALISLCKKAVGQ